VVATVYLSESNGAGPTVTDNITNCNYGNTDAFQLVPATWPIPVSENSYTKWWRIKLDALGGSNKIANLQIWKSVGAYVTGEGIQTNLRTSGYVNTTYVTPTKTTYTNQVMPIAAPGSANLGIAGVLSGELTAQGYSDYMVSQLQTTGSTPPGNANQKTLTFQYDES